MAATCTDAICNFGQFVSKKHADIKSAAEKAKRTRVCACVYRTLTNWQIHKIPFPDAKLSLKTKNVQRALFQGHEQQCLGCIDDLLLFLHDQCLSISGCVSSEQPCTLPPAVGWLLRYWRGLCISTLLAVIVGIALVPVYILLPAAISIACGIYAYLVWGEDSVVNDTFVTILMWLMRRHMDNDVSIEIEVQAALNELANVSSAMSDYEQNAVAVIELVRRGELLRRGYRLQHPCPPIGRIERSGLLRDKMNSDDPSTLRFQSSRILAGACCQRVCRSIQSSLAEIGDEWEEAEMGPEFEMVQIHLYGILEILSEVESTIDDAEGSKCTIDSLRHRIGLVRNNCKCLVAIALLCIILSPQQCNQHGPDAATKGLISTRLVCKHVKDSLAEASLSLSDVLSPEAEDAVSAITELLEGDSIAAPATVKREKTVRDLVCSIGSVRSALDAASTSLFACQHACLQAQRTRSVDTVDALVQGMVGYSEVSKMELDLVVRDFEGTWEKLEGMQKRLAMLLQPDCQRY